MGVLGSPTPQSVGRVTTTSLSSFPQATGTWTDPTGAIIIPANALDRWFAYRQTRGAVNRSVVIFGDSTTYGSGALYSWVQRLRDLATGVSTGGPVGFGMADGGKGIFAAGENVITYDAPEINGHVATTFSSGTSGASDSYDNLNGQYYYDSGATVGNTLTLQFLGTAARLWFSVRPNAGYFTYTVDGGSAVTVTTATQPNITNQFIYLSGLGAGTHTVVITNAGGIPAAPPTITGLSSDHSTGTLPASTTYNYAATFVTAAGETTPSFTGPVTTSAFATNENAFFVTNPGGTSITAIRVYCQTGGTGSFLKLGSDVTPTGGTFTQLFDTGASTPAGASPPGTNTAGNNNASPGCWIALAPGSATGVTFQKQATSGNTFGQHFLNSASAPFTQALPGFRYQTPMGLVNTPVGPPYTGAPVDTSYAAAARISPVLAMAQLGFNDLTSSATGDLAAWTEYVKRFAGACQDAGCDGIILAGQLPYNSNWPTYGAARFNALKNQALASGLGFVDLFYPVGGPSLSYPGPGANPHLTKAQYVSQADFLWNNLLGLLG